MGQAIPRQHPAVILRSQYRQLQALLAVAMIALMGLTVAVVFLATRDEGSSTSVHAATQVAAPQATGIRYDGGPEEGGHGIRHSRTSTSPPGAIRYDGGPEEGTRGALRSSSVAAAQGIRYDGGPEEGTRGSGR